MKKFIALLRKEKGKAAIKEWENNAFDISFIQCMWKNHDNFFFPHLWTCLNWDASVLLKGINIRTGS